jgi:1,2-phenylacetyl-CoA epoxidase catalytic subunit
MTELTIFPSGLSAGQKEVLFDLWRVHLTSEFSNAQMEEWVWRSPSPEILLAFAHERAKRADRANELLQVAEEAGMKDAAAIADNARYSGTKDIPHRLKIFTYNVENYVECIVYRWLYNHVVTTQTMQFFGGFYVPYESWAFRHYMEVGLDVFPTKRSHLVRDLIKELYIPGQREEVQQLLDKWLPRFLECFGSDDSERERLYISLVIKTYTNQAVRNEFLSAVMDDVKVLGLQVNAGVLEAEPAD